MRRRLPPGSETAPGTEASLRLPVHIKTVVSSSVANVPPLIGRLEIIGSWGIGSKSRASDPPVVAINVVALPEGNRVGSSRDKRAIERKIQIRRLRSALSTEDDVVASGVEPTGWT